MLYSDVLELTRVGLMIERGDCKFDSSSSDRDRIRYMVDDWGRRVMHHTDFHVCSEGTYKKEIIPALSIAPRPAHATGLPGMNLFGDKPADGWYPVLS